MANLPHIIWKFSYCLLCHQIGGGRTSNKVMVKGGGSPLPLAHLDQKEDDLPSLPQTPTEKNNPVPHKGLVALLHI